MGVESSPSTHLSRATQSDRSVASSVRPRTWLESDPRAFRQSAIKLIFLHAQMPSQNLLTEIDRLFGDAQSLCKFNNTEFLQCLPGAPQNRFIPRCGLQLSEEGLGSPLHLGACTHERRAFHDRLKVYLA